MVRQLVSAVVFDFDFTLGDSSGGVALCANHALRALGLPEVPAEAVRRTIGLPLELIFEHITGGDSADAQRFKALFIEEADRVMADHTRLYPGVPDTLTALRRSGRRLAIVSTKLRRRLEAVLLRDGLLDAFEAIVGLDTLSRPKPDPEGLLTALRVLQTPAERSVYVGDRDVDALAAASAGVPFVGVLTGATTRAELQPHPHEALLPSVTDLPDWLDG